MPNADTTLIDLAEDASLSLATYTETRAHLQRGVRLWTPPTPFRPWALDESRQFIGVAGEFTGHFPVDTSPAHVPGDTTTPPAPGAVCIGPVDV